MSVALLLLLGLLSMLVPVQVAAVSKLHQNVGAAPLAVFLSFAVGTVFLALVTASGVLGRGQLGRAGEVPWWAWTGGIMTAIVLTAQLQGLSRVGAGAAVAISVAGQLGASLVVDHFGWLGVSRVPVSGWRIGGLVLLIAGAALMQKR